MKIVLNANELYNRATIGHRLVHHTKKFEWI